jgi:hypothetical protein
LLKRKETVVKRAKGGVKKNQCKSKIAKVPDPVTKKVPHLVVKKSPDVTKRVAIKTAAVINRKRAAKARDRGKPRGKAEVRVRVKAKVKDIAVVADSQSYQ